MDNITNAARQALKDYGYKVDDVNGPFKIPTEQMNRIRGRAFSLYQAITGQEITAEAITQEILEIGYSDKDIYTYGEEKAPEKRTEGIASEEVPFDPKTGKEIKKEVKPELSKALSDLLKQFDVRVEPDEISVVLEPDMINRLLKLDIHMIVRF